MRGAGPLFELIKDNPAIPQTLQPEGPDKEPQEEPSADPNRGVREAIREEEERVQQELAATDTINQQEEREEEEKETNWQTESLRHRYNLRPNRRTDFKNITRPVYLTQVVWPEYSKTSKRWKSYRRLGKGRRMVARRTSVRFNKLMTVATCDIDKGPGEPEGKIIIVGEAAITQKFHQPCIFYAPWYVEGESNREISLLQEKSERNDMVPEFQPNSR